MTPTDFNLRSGIKFPVENLSDHSVVQEIFFHRIYEPALALTVSHNLSTHCNILDLGCNVGYFSMFAADYLANHGLHDFQVIGVDGSKNVLETFNHRIQIQPSYRLDSKIQLVHGLVGERAGSAGFKEEETFSAMNRLGDGPEVSYVDLSVCAPEGCSLLKCDIEGAEETFIRNYPDLLTKTKVAVFEFHDATVDTNECRRMLYAYGFAGTEKLVEGNTTIETFLNARRLGYVQHN